MFAFESTFKFLPNVMKYLCTLQNRNISTAIAILQPLPPKPLLPNRTTCTLHLLMIYD